MAIDLDLRERAELGDLFGAEQATQERPEPAAGRPKNRRPAAVMDPVAVVRDGQDVLNARLAELSLEQLRDIVADYGMDPGKLMMKWKDPQKVAERIVDIALTRSQKGDAFRSE